MNNLTAKERKSIEALKRVADNWPNTLWLFSANGTLCVMRHNEDGEHAIGCGGTIDQEYCVDSINIENDGGDF